jgi:isopropylmalate/homocitrate/citramalate synthase
LETVSRVGDQRSRQFIAAPINSRPEVRALRRFRDPVTIHDFTFGKMDHMNVGRLFSPDEYCEIAGLLDAIGLKSTIFQTGSYPGTLRDEAIWNGFRAVASMSRKNLKVYAVANTPHWHPRDYRDEIDRLVDAGAEGLQLSQEVGKLPSGSSNGIHWKGDDFARAIGYAKKRGAYTIVANADAPGKDLDALIERLNIHIDGGIDAIELSDSLGYATVEGTRYLVETIRGGLKRDTPIIYHAHDHFGLATAQALAATTAGAWPEATVNGIGDNGFASLDEVAMSLELLYGIDTGLRLDLLRRVSRTVERITGVRISPQKAVVGDDVRLPDSIGRYIDAVEGKDWTVMWFPFDPAIVGSSVRPVMSYGVLSESAVTAKLRSMGLPTDPSSIQRAYDGIRSSLEQLGNQFPVLLDESEVERVCREAVVA